MKSINVIRTLLLLSLASALPAAAEPFVYVPDYNDNLVGVIDTETNSVVTTIGVGSSPGGVAVSSDGKRVYVANRGSQTVSVIDTDSLSVVSTVLIGSNPTGIAISPDGLLVYVASYGTDTLKVIDAVTNNVIGSVATGDGPQGVAVDPTNGDVYVANQAADTVQHYTSALVTSRIIPVGDAPFSVDIDPSGTKIYVGNSLGASVSVLAPVGAAPVATIPVAGSPQAVAFSPDGSLAYVGLFTSSGVVEISTASDTVNAVIPVSGGVRGLSVSPNGNFVYATTQIATRFRIISANSRAIIGTTSMGLSRPIGQMASRPLAGKGGMGAGHHHQCRILPGGSINCWGRDDSGQVSNHPVTGSWRSVVAGSSHNCALNTDGTVLCWGNNSYGQLAAPSGVFTQISAGFRHTCGVRENRTVECWGQNDQGQATPPGGSFAQVEGGSSHSCGIHSDGSVECWGRNAEFQSSPVVPGNFQQLALGASFSCGLEVDGDIVCWGYNVDGQATPPSGKFTHIAAEAAYGCGIDTDGAIQCWGTNAEGQQSPPAGAFEELSLGRTSACALREEGTIECWGNNTYAQAPQMELPATLPQGQVAQPYNASAALTQTNGSVRPPYVAVNPAYVLEGSLPPGLSMDSAGQITGTPTTDGSYAFTIIAEEENGFSDEVDYMLTVVLSPPIITPTITGTMGNNGWYTGNVSISWSVTDPETAVTGTTGCGPSTQTSETIGTPFTCSATSPGGTAQQTVTIKIDKTNPTLAPTVPTNRVLLNGTVTPTINGADAISGIATATCVPGNTATVGLKVTSCTVVDMAGRSTSKLVNYRVIYAFTGFTGVLNPGGSNRAGLNQPIEFGFRLADAANIGYDGLTSASFATVSYTCPAHSTVAAATGNPVGLTSLGNGNYRLVWTSPASAGCLRLILNTGDLETTNDVLFVFQ